MKQLLMSALVLVLAGSTASAQDFEGIVEFKKQEGTVIETTVWYVRGNMVRIDEFEPGSRMLKSCYLINTKDSSVRYLDHKAKTASKYVGAKAKIPVGCRVENTKNTQELWTYKTTETVVQPNADSTFRYWIHSGRFAFFRTAAYLVGPANSYLNYYWALEPKDNAMPMLITRENAAGKETGRLEVIRVEKRTIDEHMFNVPADYTNR